MASRHVEGYVTVYDGGKQRLEHRVIMERHLGRPLTQTEVVHHRDGDKANNNLSNLELLSSQADHVSVHRLSFRSATHMECTVCHETKPYSGFYVHRSSVFGYHPHCKECQKAKKNAAYKPRTNEQRRRKMTEYNGELKELSDWARDPRSKVKYTTLFRRLQRGWDFGTALTTPAGQTPPDTPPSNQ